MDTQREEVINVELARLLTQRGLAAAPETVLSHRTPRRLPDVIVTYHGLRVVIEGKVARGHAARAAVDKQAHDRVSDGIAHVGIAVLYPRGAATTQFSELPAFLSAARLEIRVHTESGPSEWVETDLNGLGEQLSRSYTMLVRDDVVDAALRVLREAIAVAAANFGAMPATPDRLSSILDVQRIQGQDSPDAKD